MQYTAKVKNLWNKFAQPMISLNWSWIIIYYLYFIHQFKWTLRSRAIFKDVLRFEERNTNGFFLILRGIWDSTWKNKMKRELMLTYDTPALRQTGSRNLTGQKTLPTIWGTYMTLVTKYQISAINSYWEKCHEKYLGRNEGQTEVKQYTPSPFGEWGYNNLKYNL